MAIASSIFDSIHSRPASIYNRGSVELAIAVLFQQSFAIPTASLIDSPVFLSVFGEFLRARQKRASYLSVRPFELRIDPSRHFNRDEIKNVVLQSIDAYLCGRAQTGKDLTEDESHAKIIPNFAFISRDLIDDYGKRQ